MHVPVKVKNNHKSVLVHVPPKGIPKCLQVRMYIMLITKSNGHNYSGGSIGSSGFN